ncbi:helix-turn-helix transcriptional regulator [Sphingomonas sp.]|uniref:helix-turn-helix transcriptional regulator n=1 Tax=Sphingomonas sp. TaxID=28214 RepID=UPI002DD6AA35|nr:AlpA family phage regulatory protein [Sphingomonas sp.]
MKDVSTLIGLKPAAIDRAIRAGAFPRPFLIGVKAKGWDREEIEAWRRQRAADRANYADPAVPTPLSDGERAARYEAARG